MIHYRDDEKIGGILNDYFKRSNIDYTQWECWRTDSLLWALHSYLEYEDGLMRKFQVELTVLNKYNGHMSRSVIRSVYREVFKDSRYERLTALISPENRQACKFARIAGFTLEGTLRKVNHGGDINIYSVFEQEYRDKWLKSPKVNSQSLQTPLVNGAIMP